MADEPEPAVDLAALDFTKLLAGRAEIEAANAHRGPMLLLDGVVSLDPAKKLIVGYLDVRPDAFWAAGHFPRFAVMPGVLMCEAGAQLTSFYMYHEKVVKPDQLIGLGGIEDTRFRGLVRPGDRLILVGTARRTSARLTRFDVTGHVRRGDGFALAFETSLLGVALGTFEELCRA